MELYAAETGVQATIHLHASGAVTFCGAGLDPEGWGDFAGGSEFVLAVPA